MTTYTSEYPPAHNSTYVKATNYYATYFLPHFATNPELTITGSSLYNAWVTDGATTNQRFHIDLGSAKIIRRVYYENYHNSGIEYDRAAKNFTMQGSNDNGAFSTLTYATDTNWTGLTIDDTQFDQHVALDQADPKYIYVTNTTAYRYYAFKIADCWGGSYLGLRRIVLQTEDGYGLSSATFRFRGYVLG